MYRLAAFKGAARAVEGAKKMDKKSVSRKQAVTKNRPNASNAYVFGNCVFKGSPLFGYLTGLLSYILFGKNIGRMIVNKI